MSIKGGNDGAGRRARRETGYVLVMRQREGMGWQSKEIKLKESKHEGHIALGNRNSQ
jgi:hypothetical protein